MLYFIVLTFYTLLFLVSLVNFISQPILKRSLEMHDEFVSILIPARNEEKNIKNILDSIVNQDYKNYEIIVLDDSSTDKTAEIVKYYSENYNSINLIKGKELPAGWLGKNWACHQLSENALGDYFLFLDADTVIEKGLIQSSLSFIKKYELKLLSIFPDQIMKTFAEKITVPIMNNILLSLLPLLLIRKSKFSSLAAANGQFMMFEAKNYLHNKWHYQAKLEITEDITIIKLMKKNNFKCATLLGNGFIKCRMYANFSEAISGFSKNIILMLGNNMIFLFLYLFFMSWMFLIENIYFDTFKLSILLSLILSTRLFISALSKQNIIYNFIFYPFQLISLNIIAVLAFYKRINKSNIWKGRKLDIT